MLLNGWRYSFFDRLLFDDSSVVILIIFFFLIKCPGVILLLLVLKDVFCSRGTLPCCMPKLSLTSAWMLQSWVICFSPFLYLEMKWD